MAKPTVHVGATYALRHGRIDADAALAYALATNEPNGAFLDGGLVPPLYTVALIQPAFAEAMDLCADPGAIRGGRGGVHAEHDLFFFEPVRPGMAVRWQAATYGARQTPAGVLVTQRILVSDTEGTPLVEHYWSSMLLGATIDADTGPAPPDHTFPSDARGRPIGIHTFEVGRDQSYRYAGVSGDRAPHSLDDEAARQEGFPGKILQGLCTFAMCSGAAVKVGAHGDPARLRRLAGRFSAPTFPGRPLEVSLYDAGTTPDGGRALAFEATSGGATVVRHGRAELHPR